MAIDSTLMAYLDKWTRPAADKNREELQYWQERVLYSFLLMAIVLGLIVLIPSVLLSVKESLWMVAAFDILVYIWTIVLFSVRTLPYRVRAFSVAVISYGLGLVLLVVTGPFGAGPVWLFFFPLIAGLSSKLRYAMLAHGINVLTLVVFGWLITRNFNNWAFLSVHPLESWGVMVLNFLLLSFIATLAVIIIVQGLQSSLTEKKSALDLLESNYEELRVSNQRLVSEITLKNEAREHLHKSEEALKESEIRFKELVNVLPLGYFLIDDDFSLRFFNRQASVLFDFDTTSLDTRLKAQTFSFLIPDDRQRALDGISQAFKGLDTGWVSFTAITHDRRFPIEINISAIFHDNKVVGVQGLIADISDRVEREKMKTAKEIAEKTNRAISEWVSFIGHEIRTPLSAPLNYAKMGLGKLESKGTATSFSPLLQLLTDGQMSDSEQESRLSTELNQLQKSLAENDALLVKYFNRIYSASDRLNLLLDELLDLSKLESGQMSFIFQNVCILGIVQEAVFEFEAVLPEKGLELKVVKPTIETRLECDHFRIGQVIRNLLSNAVKFTPAGGKITITFESADLEQGQLADSISTPAIRVTIADGGIGIPEDQLSHVFEKFKQSRKSRSGEGTGLGLPICKEIVAAHGGSIFVISKENQGSTFYVTLPTRQSGQTSLETGGSIKTANELSHTG